MLLLDSGHFNPLLKILQWPPLPERGCSLSLIWHPMLCPAPISWRAPSALKHLSEPPKGQRLCCAHPSSAPTSPWSLEALISSASHYSSGRRWVPPPTLMSPMGPVRTQTTCLLGHVGAFPQYQAERRVWLFSWGQFPAGITQVTCSSGSTVPGRGDPWPFLPVGPWAHPSASLDFNGQMGAKAEAELVWFEACFSFELGFQVLFIFG